MPGRGARGGPPGTRTWTDGIFSHIFRQVNRPSDKEGADRERKYILFDGGLGGGVMKSVVGCHGGGGSWSAPLLVS